MCPVTSSAPALQGSIRIMQNMQDMQNMQNMQNMQDMQYFENIFGIFKCKSFAEVDKKIFKIC